MQAFINEFKKANITAEEEILTYTYQALQAHIASNVELCSIIKDLKKKVVALKQNKENVLPKRRNPNH